MGKGDWVRPRRISRGQYEENFECIFGVKKPNDEEDAAEAVEGGEFWQPAGRANGRMEWSCPHGVGHGNHIHGCDGCCDRDDYPGRKKSGGIQGNTGDGARDQTDSGCTSDVLQEPDGPSDPQTAGPVEPPPCGNCGGRGYPSGCPSCGGTF